MRPSTSGRRSIDCTASICPVAAISSRTVSVRATATSTGIAIGPPPPNPPCPPAPLFLHAPATTSAATTHHTRRTIVLSLTSVPFLKRVACRGCSRAPRERDLPSGVVPQREGHAQRQGGPVEQFGVEPVVEREGVGADRRVGEVVAQACAVRRRRRPLVRLCHAVLRPLGCRLRDRVGEAERQLRRPCRVERCRVNRSRSPDAPP